MGMATSRRRAPFAEDLDFASRTGPRRRDSDWGGSPRTHEEDLAWAARRAAVTLAAATIHARDGGTGSHSDDVVHLCGAIADDLGVYGNARAELLAAAQLHDIGKVSIPNDVLNKQAPLDDGEWALIREHTVSGEKIVGAVPELIEVARLVRHSHERWDGGGYPDGLAGEEIPLGSRIVFVADAFHAIRSDRPYRRGRSARYALSEIRRNAGAQFDPRVVDALERCAGQLRKRARSATIAPPMTLRSRRLTSLLMALAIGGSALAAESGQIFDDDGAKKDAAQAEPASGKAGESAKDGASGKGSSATADDAGDAASGPSAGTAGKRPAPRPSSSGRSGRRAPAADRPARRPAAVPQRTRTRRPQSPGRSEEAPGKPAQPGKPTVGGAPGRSEEAPRRPAEPVTPPAAKPRPQPAPRKAPVPQLRGNADGP